MANTKTKSETKIELMSPPKGGDIALSSGTILEEAAHKISVLLDRSENFRVAVGQELLLLLNTQFGGNRSALRDWYEAEIYQFKENRAWNTVERYLGAVSMHGDNAANIIASREQQRRERDRQAQREIRAAALRERSRANDFNDLGETRREPKSEYDQRKIWLSRMDYLWFKGEREWQNKWLRDRELRRG